MGANLVSGFLESSERWPREISLEVEGQYLTYTELQNRAAAIADVLERTVPDVEPSLTAVYGHRTVTAFAGVLGILMRGHGYVPLNPAFPPERTALMLDRAGCHALIADRPSLNTLSRVLPSIDRQLTVVIPDQNGDMDIGLGHHRVITAEGLDNQAPIRRPTVDPSSIAYLLFTSGSTGEPKGVMVSHQNARHFIDYMTDYYSVNEKDRFSQTFDLTFDLSVFDMFIAWEGGATVCCPSQKQLLRPDLFVQSAELTVWFSVPSLAIYMERVGMLKPEAFPSLRLSLFCGEPLPLEIAASWSASAPQAVLENLYGPTELTIACMNYRWDHRYAEEDSQRGIVPIGYPYPGMEPLVVDDQLKPVSKGSPGELLMSGPQMSLGYWNDPDKTEQAFVTPPGHDRLFYRTGDRVRVSEEDGPFLYLGRVDHQIKVRGFRVELGEIEAALREAANLSGAVAVGWPVTPSGAAAIEAFLEGEKMDLDRIRDELESRLPPYMVPRRIHLMPSLPLNANGKYDRNALLTKLEEGL